MAGTVSVLGRKAVGIPTLLFHEGEGLTLCVETRDGTLYRGIAEMTEDNMNVSLHRALAFGTRGGEPQKLERVFIRGSQIVFVSFPEILNRAPFFQRVRNAAQGRVVAVGLGKTRQAAIQAKGENKGKRERRERGEKREKRRIKRTRDVCLTSSHFHPLSSPQP
jgi:small nuclear ribonucleoprotein D3